MCVKYFFERRRCFWDYFGRIDYISWFWDGKLRCDDFDFNDWIISRYSSKCDLIGEIKIWFFSFYKVIFLFINEKEKI